jgi:hypothetical protein
VTRVVYNIGSPYQVFVRLEVRSHLLGSDDFHVVLIFVLIVHHIFIHAVLALTILVLIPLVLVPLIAGVWVELHLDLLRLSRALIGFRALLELLRGLFGETLCFCEFLVGELLRLEVTPLALVHALREIEFGNLRVLIVRGVRVSRS